MLDPRRTWMRRLGTTAGLVLLVFAFYQAVLYTPHHCLTSTPQRQYACDVGSPSHPHFVLGLVIAAAGIALVVGSRRAFSDN